MPFRWWILAPVLLALLALPCCQVIAGIQSRDVDPILPGCRLPSVGDGKLRLVNLVPDTDRVDFCVRASGTAWGRPILRDGGSACPAGYPYEGVSAAFAVPAGNIDVEAIPAGKTCSAPALSQVEKVPVAAGGPPVTIIRLGGDKTPEALLASTEDPETDTATQRLRFVNASPGSAPQYFGIGMADRLPTTLVSNILAQPLAFGQATTPSSPSALGTTDQYGYVAIPNTPIIVGEGPSAAQALAVWDIPQPLSHYTFYAVGDPNNASAYPPRGFYCNDTPGIAGDGLTTSCTETALATISVDVFNAQLYGGASPYESVRQPYIYSAIAARPSDVQCIDELDAEADRTAVINAAKSAFPYSVTFTSDLTTPPTDPHDQSGNIPPPPSGPPCGPPVDPTAYSNFIQCLENKCASPVGPTGTLSYPMSSTPSDCLSHPCVNSILPLYNGDLTAQNCSDCVVVNTVSLYPYSQVDSTCSTITQPPMAFQGQTPSLILSRYPIMASQTYVLPSTYWRRVVHEATLQLEEGKTIDFYCAQLTSTSNASTLPYTGNYGNGADQSDAYLQEQIFQMQRTISFIKAQSGSNPAILAIDLHASKAYPPDDAGAAPDGGGQVLTDLSPEVYALLDGDSTFQHAVPEGYVPQCLECPAPTNPYNGDTPPVQWLDVYAYQFPSGPPAASVSVFANQPVVPLPDGTMGMLSATFGYNVEVIRP